MPQSDYVYRRKVQDRQDYQAQFMLPQEDWQKFKDICKRQGTKPSKVLKAFIKDYNDKNE